MSAREVTRGLNISCLVEWGIPEGKEKESRLCPLCADLVSLPDGPLYHPVGWRCQEITVMRLRGVRQSAQSQSKDVVGKGADPRLPQAKAFPKFIPCGLRLSQNKACPGWG